MELTVSSITIRFPSPRGLLRLAALTLATVVVALCAAGKGVQSAGTYSIATPDTNANGGTRTSLALDASGFPVIAYMYSADLKVMHCNDPNCVGAAESITFPDVPGVTGNSLALQLDASGLPVISYTDGSSGEDLKIMHCNDANCAGGGESITTPDTPGDVGVFNSLELDASGFPVVSYQDFTNQDLKVMHCDDVNCAGVESIMSPDTVGNVGYYTSLTLDGSGFPVVSHFRIDTNDLKVMHCNDPNCSGGDDSITSPDTAGVVGEFTSLALDGSGFPVVSYYDGSNANLKLMHCNDANCAGGGESFTSPDTADDVGRHTSLALDSNGFPVVSYYDVTNGNLKLMRCNDVNCAGNDEDIVSPDTGGDIGQASSLTLDGSGFPVVSYIDVTNTALKVAHAGGKPSLQLDITNVGQYALPKTCFEVRDGSQVALFTVCDNDFQGVPASHAACVPDAVCQDEDSTPGRVRVALNSDVYRIVESEAAPEHTADASNQLCSEAAGCSPTFINAPSTEPWFPWDVTGDGAVSGFDFFEVLGKFGQTK